ncbi:phospholipase D-like domain-containing protein [Peptoniphilus catoniae]|uniref:phospholipase D-like domain-containing protein n=1 Tax=Peptoniphilus catoniae TaxID=1660341 RepID=UPI001FE9F000|nr:phospholipase D-like domain-containing protein [Peptoniphilus catoniae]
MLLLLIFLIPLIYSLFTKNPKGTNLAGDFTNPIEVKYIEDLSYSKDNKTVHELNIFKEEMDLIEKAEDFLIIDLFLYNDDYTKSSIQYPTSVSDMTDAIIAKKNRNPSMPIVFITDPINNFYGAYEQTHLKRLKDAGINVVVTDHNKMRDSNPIFSGYYRFFIKWFGIGEKGFIRNFFDANGPKVTIRSILKLANFKGNHRKVFISENEAMIASANPHDPSSFHSNVALRFKGEAIKDLIESEKSVVEFSGGDFPDIKVSDNFKGKDENIKLRILTESEILKALLENINRAESEDEIYIGIFYLSDFKVLKSLASASDRGVKIKIVADPNKDAFGIEKNGNPNRSALCTLAEKNENIDLRWYDTRGEQYHTKMAFFKYNKSKLAHVILGSANFTKRNLENYNLETDVELVTDLSGEIPLQISNYFKRVWNNEDGNYTLPMETYYEDSPLMNILWRFQEFTGLCTW